MALTGVQPQSPTLSLVPSEKVKGRSAARRVLSAVLSFVSHQVVISRWDYKVSPLTRFDGRYAGRLLDEAVHQRKPEPGLLEVCVAGEELLAHRLYILRVQAEVMDGECDSLGFDHVRDEQPRQGHRSA